MAKVQDYVKTRAEYDSVREKASITSLAQANNTIMQQDDDIEELLLIIAGGENDGTL